MTFTLCLSAQACSHKRADASHTPPKETQTDLHVHNNAYKEVGSRESLPGGDGVADRGGNQVEVLDDAAEKHILGAQVVPDCSGVCIIALANKGPWPFVAHAVTVAQQEGAVQGDCRKHQLRYGACNPSQLGCGPCKGQHPGPNDSCDDVSGSREGGACSSSMPEASPDAHARQGCQLTTEHQSPQPQLRELRSSCGRCPASYQQFGLHHAHR